MNLTDNEVFTIALHESAHYITFIYYSAMEGLRNEVECITIIEDDYSLGFFKSKGEADLIITNLLKSTLAGYAIEFVEERKGQFKSVIEFIFNCIWDKDRFADKSDLNDFFKIIEENDIFRKYDFGNPMEIFLEYSGGVVEDCKTLRQDINDVAKLLFEKKTIEGKEIKELTDKYYSKYNK